MLAANRIGRHTSSACLLPKVRLKLLRNLRKLHPTVPAHGKSCITPKNEKRGGKKKKKGMGKKKYLQ